MFGRLFGPRNRAKVVLLLCTTLVVTGCKSEPKKSEKGTAAAKDARETEDIPLPVVSETAPNLLFSYVGKSGQMISVAEIAEVPEKARERVLVVDLSKTPQERMAHRYAFFADLSEKNDEGQYDVTVVSRYKSAKGEGPPAGILPANNADIIVYSAVWCGFCRKLEKWLDENGTPYLKRDVQKDPGADRELKAKLAQAGISSGGIPVTDVAGNIVVGFNKPKLAALIEQWSQKEKTK
ncbi:MAG: hypothetical protein CMH56_16260 [Myxococcales bacterium]|nr:hypothetical protein [Myxococcales bacterium]